MRYATLMVNLAPGRQNDGLLRVTADLAERFQAGVVGIAARQPLQMVYGDGYMAGDVYQQDRDDTVKELKATEAQFRAALQGRAAFVEWRSAEVFAYLADYLAQEARCADLLLTSANGGDLFDASRAVNTGELILQCGRPVLIVPAAATHLALAHALIGWKDTREARRAVSDSLPLLKMATRVTVVALTTKDGLSAAGRQVLDVVAWLRHHGVIATGSAQLSTGDDATALYAIGQDSGIDVFIAGAYGHSRVREWVLGGVTRDLLLSANRCSLVSH